MTYLAIQNTYDEVQIALCANQEMVARTTINKINASAHCIPAIDTLLTQHNLTLADLSCIVANCGPGPFTTLRVVLTTVNGIQAASSLPLIGIDSLDALIQEYSNSAYPLTVALLNAFNQDVYYAVSHTPTHTITKGCQNITECITQLAQTYPGQPIQFLGNGVMLHQEFIKNMFGAYAYIPSPIAQTCSLEQIARMGLAAWEQGKSQTTPLTPHYIKSATPKN